MTGLRRAAFIAEHEDGSRLIYELHDPILELEHDDVMTWTCQHVRFRTHVTITGEFAGGTVWHGDMPTVPTPELSAPKKEIES